MFRPDEPRADGLILGICMDERQEEASRISEDTMRNNTENERQEEASRISEDTMRNNMEKNITTTHENTTSSENTERSEDIITALKR